MNSIMGIRLSNILIEKGQDHDRVSAEIIMDNKRVGDVVNDGWCDEYYIEFLDVNSELEFEKRINKYYKNKKIKSEVYDIFIKDLLFKFKKYKSVRNSKLNYEQLTFLWK